MSVYVEGFFFKQLNIGNVTSQGFTNWGLKFVISEGAKKVSHPGLTFTPPHFRISERTFKKTPREGLRFTPAYLRIYEGIKSFHLHLDN